MKIEHVIIDTILEEIAKQVLLIEKSVCYTNDLKLEDLRYKQGILQGYKTVTSMLDVIQKDITK